MATIQQLLDDINLRYKNTFSTDQKIVWMNEEQRELFEILEIESTPYAFNLVANTYLYPIDSGIDIEKIKTVTIQINDQSPPSFQTLPFLRNDDDVPSDPSIYWYTIISGNFYVNVPGGPVANRSVYIYTDSKPTDLSSGSLNIEPSVPVKHQELLKLGTLKRIAAARKDVDMYNNYAADYEAKIVDLEWSMKASEPEFIQPVSMLPMRRGILNGRVAY